MLVENSGAGAGSSTGASAGASTNVTAETKEASSATSSNAGTDTTQKAQEETNPIKNAVGSMLEGIDDAKDFINDQRYNFTWYNPLGPVRRAVDAVFPTLPSVISNGVDKGLDFVRDKFDIEDPDDVAAKSKEDARSARGMQWGHADSPLLDDLWEDVNTAVDDFKSQVQEYNAKQEGLTE